MEHKPTKEKIADAYSRYDSDPRVNGPDDIDAFFDALLPLFAEAVSPAPSSLFAGDESAAMIHTALLEDLRYRYREMLLLNPPTQSFNRDVNPNAEKFAGFAAKKDMTRFLAALDKTGLMITTKGK